MTSAFTAYRENTVGGASAVGLVVMLYEQLIQDLIQAAQALEQHQIELRTDRINHAVLVLGHLQSALDFEKGGKVAQDLDHFYNVLRQNLVQVQFSPSKGRFRQLITDLLTVREAWIEVQRAEGPLAARAGVAAPSSGGDGSAPDAVRLDWKG